MKARAKGGGQKPKPAPEGRGGARPESAPPRTATAPPTMMGPPPPKEGTVHGTQTQTPKPCASSSIFHGPSSTMAFPKMLLPAGPASWRIGALQWPQI